MLMIVLAILATILILAFMAMRTTKQAIDTAARTVPGIINRF